MNHEEIRDIVLEKFAGVLEGDTKRLYSEPDIEIQKNFLNSESFNYMIIASALEDALDISIDPVEMQLKATTPKTAVEFIEKLMNE